TAPGQNRGEPAQYPNHRVTHARARSPAAATDLLRPGSGKGSGTGSRERDRDCVLCRHLPGLGNPSSGTCSCVLAGEPREGEGPSAGPASARVTWCRWQRQHRCARAGAARRRASGGEVRALSISRRTRDKGGFMSKGLPEARTDTAMSELVPEPRPKPAVPMKPVSINSNLLGYIGIDTIIEQMRKKTMKTGFDFNIMVVGQSGLGKSTLVNTLFKSQVSRKASSWNREEKIPKTVEIKAIGHVIEEGGVKMKLTVIDTPGFGDQINNENCWEPIEKYINEQYEKFLKEEVNIARKKRIPDTRVHCCLYFISPTGHSLRPLDLEFMKHLSKVVNIIPVIAKADTMTLEEKSEFKQRVRKELEVNGIEFYPQKEFDEDLEDKTENDKIRESMPFAVVGSDKEYQVNGKKVLGRKTPWGIIEVENLNHCEFALLRDFVIRTHLQDLKEVTHNIHYETYRAKRLNDNGGLPPVSVDTEESHDSNP
ncbi:Neuronal-specific septin-3, partial [Lemmus lemmus]